MSSLLPGVCAEVPAAAIRVYLGTQPTVTVERRLIRTMQPVWPWFSSLRRVKDQASEFLEVDASSCDVELMLRHSHVYFSRRQLFMEMLERQLKVLEVGKPPKEASASLLNCLMECGDAARPRAEFEQRKLTSVKLFCKKPFRRELSRTSPLDPWDLPCMMRCDAEDMTSLVAEGQAKAYLPLEVVEQSSERLASFLLQERKPLEKKDSRLIAKHIPRDYDKVGLVPRVRPLDVTAYYRFVGERMVTGANASVFQRALVGNIFRRYALHPAYLSSISSYWSIRRGTDKTVKQTRMPLELATLATAQQQCHPATRLRLSLQYASLDHAKAHWRTEPFVPLMRLMPLIGEGVAEELAAQLLVDGFWSSLQLKPEANALSEDVLSRVRSFIRDTSSMRLDNPEAVFASVKSAAAAVIPGLTEAEANWKAPPDVDETAAADLTAGEDQDMAEVAAPEGGELPSEAIRKAA